MYVFCPSEYLKVNPKQFEKEFLILLSRKAWIFYQKFQDIKMFDKKVFQTI